MQKAAPMALRACRTVRSAANRGTALVRVSPWPVDCALLRAYSRGVFFDIKLLVQHIAKWQPAGACRRPLHFALQSTRQIAVGSRGLLSLWDLVLPWSKCWVSNWWQGTPYTKQMINKLKVKSTVTEKDLKPLQFALAIKNMGQKGGQCNGHILFPTDLKWTFEICLLLRFANCKRSAKSTR